MSPYAHTCSICSRTFGRNTHLRRHEASHGEARHKCPFCSKTFARRDASRRHAQACSHRDSTTTLQTNKRGRKPQACNWCSKRKLSCDKKSPCGRCAARGLTCTYSPTSQGLSRVQPPSTETRSIPVSFLLDLTDPSSKSVTGVFASQDPDIDLVHSTSPSCWNEVARPDHTQAATTDLGSIFWGVDNPLGDLLFDNWVVTNHTDTPFGFTDDPNGHLQLRLNALASELRDLDKCACSRNRINIQSTGPTERDYENIFTATSFLELTSTFFQRRHWQWPILHLPTFDPHQASFPLLLAIALSGAAFSRPDDKAAEYSPSAEAFHRIAETYIFNGLEVLTAPGAHDLSSNGAIEACQAALLIDAFLISINDRDTRRRIITKRHPSLVASTRAIRLASTRYSHSLDMLSWDAFIRHESLVRLVTWTFVADSVLPFCNQAPSMAVSEMVGDLPCDEELWAADSEAEFELKVQTKCSARQPYSIRLLMARLLDDDEWKSQPAINRNSSFGPSLEHLNVALWGMIAPPLSILFK